MRDTTVKFLDGRTLCAPIWEWRPQEGWLSLAGHDERVYLCDVEYAVTPQAEGAVRDEIERAKEEGYDPIIHQAIPVYGAPPFIAMKAPACDDFGTAHVLYLDGYTDLKKAVVTMRTFPAFRDIPMSRVVDFLRNPENIVLGDFYDWTFESAQRQAAEARKAELEAGGLKVRIVSEAYEHEYSFPPGVMIGPRG